MTPAAHWLLGQLFDLEVRCELYPHLWPRRRWLDAMRLIRHGSEWLDATRPASVTKETA